MEVSVLDGDGIGPEIVPAARQAIEATGMDVEFVGLLVGWEAYDEYGSTIPKRTIDRLKECDGWLLGPIVAGEYPEDDQAEMNPSGTLRKYFDLYSNVRPIRAYSGIGPAGMDLTIFRQNTEGLYADRNMHVGDGRFMPTEDVALSIRVTTRKNCKRIAESAFAFADAEGKDVTTVHKANVLQHGDGMFVEECEKVSERYPDVELESYLVDAFAMELVVNPTAHEVVVTTNAFGDILSDEAAGVVGSLGLAAGLNHGDEHAMAQAAHGAAPDIAGDGIANPTAMILSGAMLLNWLGTEQGFNGAFEAAAIIEEAVTETINDGVRTADLGGDADTAEFADAVAARIRS